MAVADGPLHQRGGHRGIHAAGQPANRPPVTDLGAHLLDQHTGDVGGGPVRTQPGEVVQEAAEYLLPVRGVHDLRVVLHTGQPPLPVLEAGYRSTGTAGHHLEPIRRDRDRIAMAHPYRLNGR